MTKHLISAVIPNWNGKHLLPVILDSLAKQIKPVNQTVVVDNGSSDGSVEYLAANYPHVHVVVLDKNYGFAAAVSIFIFLIVGGLTFFNFRLTRRFEEIGAAL